MAKQRILPKDEPLRTPRELLAKYKEVFGVCDVEGCDEDRARGEIYCDKHVLVDAF